ncbi:hypothetical protein B484DRAFT_406341 [Ochromonadaceae sp. CCMP2298]|nr:hypothetical protein B484DRAFT_406341 [Ochromonadaceae sp. CCMP2298]
MRRRSVGAYREGGEGARFASLEGEDAIKYADNEEDDDDKGDETVDFRVHHADGDGETLFQGEVETTAAFHRNDPSGGMRVSTDVVFGGTGGELRVETSFLSINPLAVLQSSTRLASNAARVSANTVIATAAATTQEPPTTKDDMCRLLALRSDPEAQVTWAAAQEGNTTRRDLDARRSTSAPNGLSGSLAEEADPYGTLSVQFNDFDTFLPQNMLLAHRDGLQVVPYRPAYVEVTYLASFCNELNPTNLAREQILRDGPWIKKTWKSLKATLSSIFEDFLCSGINRGNSNDSEVEWLSPHECERWIRKCNIKHRLYPDVSAYAYGVMDKADFHSLGKTQEKGTGRGNTIAGARESRAEEANQARRERTGKRKGASAAKGGGGEIADALKLSSSNELQMKSHELMMQWGDAAAKLSAMAAIQYFGEHGCFANQLRTPAVSSQPSSRRRLRSTSSAESGSGVSADSDSEDDSQRLVGGGVIGPRRRRCE